MAGFLICLFGVKLLFICFVRFIGNFSSFFFSKCLLDHAGLGPCYRAEPQLGEYFHISVLKSWMDLIISYNTRALQLFALGWIYLQVWGG